MINEITEFKISTLDHVFNYLIDKRNTTDSLVAELGILTHKNEIGTIIIEPENDLFKTIVLSVEGDSLNQVSFYGRLSFSFSDLVAKYGMYREVYSAYDDLYFLLF